MTKKQVVRVVDDDERLSRLEARKFMTQVIQADLEKNIERIDELFKEAVNNLEESRKHVHLMISMIRVPRVYMDKLLFYRENVSKVCDALIEDHGIENFRKFMIGIQSLTSYEYHSGDQ